MRVRTMNTVRYLDSTILEKNKMLYTRSSIYGVFGHMRYTVITKGSSAFRTLIN